MLKEQSVFSIHLWLVEEKLNLILTPGLRLFLSVTCTISGVLGHMGACHGVLYCQEACFLRPCENVMSSRLLVENKPTPTILVVCYCTFIITTGINLLSSNNNFVSLIALVSNLIGPMYFGMNADHARTKLYANTTAAHRNLQSKGYIVNLDWIEVNGPGAMVEKCHFYLLSICPCKTITFSLLKEKCLILSNGW